MTTDLAIDVVEPAPASIAQAVDDVLVGLEVPEPTSPLGLPPAAPVSAREVLDAEKRRVRRGRRRRGVRVAGEETLRIPALRGWVARQRRRTGTSRTLRRLVRCTQQASAAGRPVALLAGLLAHLRRTRPRGMSAYTAYVLAVMILSGDWRSGRRCRPGYIDTAVIVGCSTRTVERQWLVLEAAVAQRTGGGRHLSTTEHDALVADGAVCVHGLSAAEAAEARHQARQTGARYCTTRFRAEFDVASLAEVGIDSDDLTEAAIAEAEQILADVASALDPVEAEPVVEPPAPEDPEKTPQCTHVFPSPVGGSHRNVPARTHHPYAPAARREEPSRAGSGHCTTAGTSWGRSNRQRRGGGSAGRRLDPAAVTVARQMIKDSRLPQLRRAELPMLTQAITGFVRDDWTATQLVQAAQDAVAARNVRWGYYDPPYVPARPVAWLTSLLREAMAHPITEAELWTREVRAIREAERRRAEKVAAAAAAERERLERQHQAEVASVAARKAELESRRGSLTDASSRDRRRAAMAEAFAAGRTATRAAMNRRRSR